MVQSQYEPYAPHKSSSGQAAELGQHALDQATEAATIARDKVKEHPITTLVAIGGLAFALGALWKLQQSSKTTRVDRLMDRLSELQQQLPKRWRA